MNEETKAVRRRVVCLTGSKEGAGKTTLALNLALAWAGIQSRGVVIVHLDPLCRDDISAQLGLEPPTLADLVRDGDAAPRGAPRLTVPLSQWGVGCVPMAGCPAQAARVFPAAARRALERLSAAHDLFLDVEPSSPLRRMAQSLATMTFWTCLPHRSHLDPVFDELSGGRTRPVEVVVNQSDMPGALGLEEVSAHFARLGWPVCPPMPHERELPGMANRRKLFVVERPHSPWVKALRPLLGRLMEAR